MGRFPLTCLKTYADEHGGGVRGTVAHKLNDRFLAGHRRGVGLVHPRHGQDPALFAAGFNVLAVLPNTGQVESPAA